MQETALFSAKLPSWPKSYTTAGRAGRDKFQIWPHPAVLALAGQPEKAAIFCKGCYAALHGHRSRYKIMFFVHLKYLERFVTLLLKTWSLVTRLLVIVYARSKSIGAVDYSQFLASSSDSKCRGCEAKV